MELEKLYCQNSGGKLKEWSIGVVSEANDISVIVCRYGITGGKIVETQKEIKSGKNLGKVNATTSFQQACKEAESKWTKKREEGYTPKKDVADEKGARATNQLKGTLLPMLALDYTKRKKDIIFPCYVQPKLDGVRAIFNGEKLTSRTGKEYTVCGHIKATLPENLLLDGELYSMDMPFEALTGLCRKKKLTIEEQKVMEKSVFLYVFDCYHTQRPEMSFEERYQLLKSLELPKGVKLVPTQEMKTADKLGEIHAKYTQDGFEGTILRNKQGAYKPKDRSKDLQKFKSFEDAEFIICGYYEGSGTDKETVIWECSYKTVDGDTSTFKCRPRGTKEQRKEWLREAQKYIGKKLTVRYQELTHEGCPRFPVGISIRDYE